MKGKTKSIQALRQQHSAKKRERDAAAKRRSDARMEIELLREQKFEPGVLGLPRWDDGSHDETEFEKHLLKSNLNKREKDRRLSTYELKSAISEWPVDELNILWGMRETKLSTQFDAALLLAHIRYRMGIDTALQSIEKTIQHESITALENILPLGLRETQDFSSSANADNSKKRIDLIRQTVREGQAKFRKQLLDYYEGKCLISGVNTPQVIEAAHIAPYSGSLSNGLENGLLLRVDLHRLFDCYMLGIEPGSLNVHVSKDAHGYEHLEGLTLKSVNNIAASKSLLANRWKKFGK